MFTRDVASEEKANRPAGRFGAGIATPYRRWLGYLHAVNGVIDPQEASVPGVADTGRMRAAV
jgi:hypothetical protein